MPNIGLLGKRAVSVGHRTETKQDFDPKGNNEKQQKEENQPAAQHGGHLAALGQGQRPGEHTGIALEREIEGAQEEIERLVMRIGRDLPAGGAAAGIEALGQAQPFPQGDQGGGAWPTGWKISASACSAPCSSAN